MWVNGVYSLWPGQEMHLIASQPTWPTSPSTSSSSTSLTSSTSTSYPSYTVYPRHCQAERAQNNQGFHSVGNSVTILKLPQLHSAANNIAFYQSLVAVLCEPDSAGEQDLCFLQIFKSLFFCVFLYFCAIQRSAVRGLVVVVGRISQLNIWDYSLLHSAI